LGESVWKRDAGAVTVPVPAVGLHPCAIGVKPLGRDGKEPTRNEEETMRKKLRMAGIAGAGALAILCAGAGAELLGVASVADAQSQIVQQERQATAHTVWYEQPHCQPLGSKWGVTCWQ
jgi:hypothetical protein